MTQANSKHVSNNQEAMNKNKKTMSKYTEVSFNKEIQIGQLSRQLVA